MNKKEIMHVRLEREKIAPSRKDLLSSEINLLNMKKFMRNYYLLRREELKIKLKLYRKMKDMGKTINRLQNVLPKIKIPKTFVKNTESNFNLQIPVEEKIEITKNEKYDSDLEKQLREIQEKLRSLER